MPFVPFVARMLVVRPGAPGSVLAPSSMALVATSDALVPSSFLLLVVRPGAPRSYRPSSYFESFEVSRRHLGGCLIRSKA